MMNCCGNWIQLWNGMTKKGAFCTIVTNAERDGGAKCQKLEKAPHLWAVYMPVSWKWGESLQLKTGKERGCESCSNFESTGKKDKTTNTVRLLRPISDTSKCPFWRFVRVKEKASQTITDITCLSVASSIRAKLRPMSYKLITLD